MKKQNYIVAILATMFVGGAYASQEGKLAGNEARKHYEKQYDDLINRFDTECYLSPFSWLATEYQVEGCRGLTRAIDSINRHLLQEFRAEQFKHYGGKRNEAMEYWKK